MYVHVMYVRNEEEAGGKEKYVFLLFFTFFYFYVLQLSCISFCPPSPREYFLFTRGASFLYATRDTLLSCVFFPTIVSFLLQAFHNSPLGMVYHSRRTAVVRGGISPSRHLKLPFCHTTLIGLSSTRIVLAKQLRSFVVTTAITGLRITAIIKDWSTTCFCTWCFRFIRCSCHEGVIECQQPGQQEHAWGTERGVHSILYLALFIWSANGVPFHTKHRNSADISWIICRKGTMNSLD